MKQKARTLLFALLPMVGSLPALAGFYGLDFMPSAPAAGQAGSTAVYRSGTSIVSWADGYADVQYGPNADAMWQTPAKALGPAIGDSMDVVSLGDGGRITLTFPNGIGDGPGADFCVFENGFNNGFLELAYVEVSSDGTNFVRFPNYSYTETPVAQYGSVDPRLLYNLASKYRRGYGTPFDLNDLKAAYAAALAGDTDFSAAFTASLTNNYPRLELSRITHVRLVDIRGDGSALDARGQPVYDPYPTIGSGGFDLEAVGVIHESFTPPVPYADWAAAKNVSTNGLGDADSDGLADFAEYMMGGDPNDAASTPAPALSASTNAGFIVFEYPLNPAAVGTASIQSVDALGDVWSNAVPDHVEQQTLSGQLNRRAYFPADRTNRFFRLLFQ